MKQLNSQNIIVAIKKNSGVRCRAVSSGWHGRASTILHGPASLGWHGIDSYIKQPGRTPTINIYKKIAQFKQIAQRLRHAFCCNASVPLHCIKSELALSKLFELCKTNKIKSHNWHGLASYILHGAASYNLHGAASYIKQLRRKLTINICKLLLMVPVLTGCQLLGLGSVNRRPQSAGFREHCAKCLLQGLDSDLSVLQKTLKNAKYYDKENSPIRARSILLLSGGSMPCRASLRRHPDLAPDFVTVEGAEVQVNIPLQTTRGLASVGGDIPPCNQQQLTFLRKVAKSNYLIGRPSHKHKTGWMDKVTQMGKGCVEGGGKAMDTWDGTLSLEDIGEIAKSGGEFVYHGTKLYDFDKKSLERVFELEDQLKNLKARQKNYGGVDEAEIKKIEREMTKLIEEHKVRKSEANQSMGKAVCSTGMKGVMTVIEGTADATKGAAKALGVPNPHGWW